MKQSDLKQNERLLIQAFKSQNEEAYDDALQKLQMAGDNLIRMIQKIEYNSQFYMKHMPLMKQQRQLVSQKDYKEFMAKNEKILCRNFQKNAYLALLMQEMQQKKNKEEKRKWTSKQQQILLKMIEEKVPMKQVYHRFTRRSKHQIDEKCQELTEKIQKKQKNQQKIENGLKAE